MYMTIKEHSSNTNSFKLTCWRGYVDSFQVVLDEAAIVMDIPPILQTNNTGLKFLAVSAHLLLAIEKRSPMPFNFSPSVFLHKLKQGIGGSVKSNACLPLAVLFSQQCPRSSVRNLPHLHWVRWFSQSIQDVLAVNQCEIHPPLS